MRILNFGEPKLTPEQVALLDTQESDMLAAFQEQMIDVYKHHRLAGKTRGLCLIGLVERSVIMLPTMTVQQMASLIAVAAVKIGDAQLREEGFED